MWGSQGKAFLPDEPSHWINEAETLTEPRAHTFLARQAGWPSDSWDLHVSVPTLRSPR